jgi:hypothetical protein
MPAAQASALLNPSSDPAPFVNCGVWLTPSVGIVNIPWNPGTAYETLPNKLLAKALQIPDSSWYIPISVEAPDKVLFCVELSSKVWWPMARITET